MTRMPHTHRGIVLRNHEEQRSFQHHLDGRLNQGTPTFEPAFGPITGFEAPAVGLIDQFERDRAAGELGSNGAWTCGA
jgi:hypothetical protein